MKHWSLLVAIAVATISLAACSSSGPRTTAGAGSGDPIKPAPSSGLATGEVPYSLYTHCGIREARIGETYYLADTPLDDGTGNPPAGWGNPYQPGTVTIPSPSVAIFRDDLGHIVRFHERPGATDFLQICS
jgi:hypothetical protein